MAVLLSNSSEAFRIEQGEDQIGAQPQGYGQAEKRFEHNRPPFRRA
jgi:hypothetical protein